MDTSSLKTEARAVLMQLVQAIHQLNLDEYTEKIPLLNKRSIGEHSRHIIEVFQQLMIGYHSGKLNYDNRKRDLNLAINIDFAIESIAKIIGSLDKEDVEIELVSLYTHGKGIQTSYMRELLYTIDHTIHHLAQIKIAFTYLDVEVFDENFGEAKSTIMNQEQSED